MPYFNYLNTHTDAELKITVADLRDLVNAAFLGDESDKVAELQLILSSIAFKNLLQADALTLVRDNTPAERQQQAPKI